MMRFLWGVSLSAACLWPGALMAGDLKILDGEGAERASYSQDDIEAMGMRELRTSTPWTEGTMTFEGVDGRKVLEDAGIGGARVTAIALDDYVIEIEWEDFTEHEALFATRMNGKRLTPSDRGPVWIVFDYDEVEAGNRADLRSKSVWRLVEIEAE